MEIAQRQTVDARHVSEAESENEDEIKKSQLKML
jgi:hypothetical protein